MLKFYWHFRLRRFFNVMAKKKKKKENSDFSNNKVSFGFCNILIFKINLNIFQHPIQTYDQCSIRM